MACDRGYPASGLARVVDVRNKWITDGVATSELPYVRLALVVAPVARAPAKAKRGKAGR